MFSVIEVAKITRNLKHIVVHRGWILKEPQIKQVHRRVFLKLSLLAAISCAPPKTIHVVLRTFGLVWDEAAGGGCISKEEVIAITSTSCMSSPIATDFVNIRFSTLSSVRFHSWSATPPTPNLTGGFLRTVVKSFPWIHCLHSSFGNVLAQKMATCAESQECDLSFKEDDIFSPEWIGSFYRLDQNEVLFCTGSHGTQFFFVYYCCIHTFNKRAFLF